MKNKLFVSAFAVAAMALASCASGIKKADISSSANPSEEIARLEADIAKGYENHYDLLAVDDFNSSQKYLKKAKSELADGDSQADVLEEIAYGRAYLDRTRATAESRRPQVEGILNARQEALKSHVRAYPPTQARLKALDDEVRSNAKDFRSMDAKEIAGLQADYPNLQFDAVKNHKLGQARALIEGAKKERAATYAPKALRKAEVDLANAVNMLNANRNNPPGYEKAVAQADLSAETLAAVVKATNRGRVDESTATQIVMQDRRIQSLQGRVGSLQGQLGETSREVGQVNQTLDRRNRELAAAAATINLQKSLKEARAEFSPEEAEVFQEGDKLLIRLKAMNFSSGRAELPASSMNLLAKVKNVAEDLGPAQVLVEGHTDATGSAAINDKLSQERADSVARYLATSGIEEDKIEAKGFGFEKPIASNKSSVGRAQNRRVDILITPAAPSDTERAPASVEE
ncbi:MAG TPA: OmpA family protein [Pseudobdellovibrionaceae bacterium]|nr:OmpA family protein [Pseudobdellovibrionaceae bacterium]